MPLINPMRLRKPSSETICVGTTRLSYNSIRNFAALPYRKYTFREVTDLYRVPTYLLFKLLRKTDLSLLNSFNSCGLSAVSFFHFFNTINFGPGKFFVTFEHILPRFGPASHNKIKRGLEVLESDKCLGLIAMSEYARESQRVYLVQQWPQYANNILRKIRVVPPSQSANELVEPTNTQSVTGRGLRFSIVGADFFRKGGLEILRVFDRLLSEKAPLGLNIISTLDIGDYASRSTGDQRREALSIIGKHAGRINHIRYLKNSGVLELIRNSTDVMLLPSYDETYGYSVLEGQAFGKPAITTDVGAFPEFNSNDVGWLVPVTKDPDPQRCKRAYFRHTEGRREVSLQIEKGLDWTIRSILDNPGEVQRRGKSAYQMIKLRHDPTHLASVLEEMYESAVDR